MADDEIMYASPPPVQTRAASDPMLLRRSWSNDELNQWLRQALKAEREAIRLLTKQGLTRSQEKNNDRIAEHLKQIMEHIFAEMKKVADELAGRIDKTAAANNANTEIHVKAINAAHERITRLEKAMDVSESEHPVLTHARAE